MKKCLLLNKVLTMPDTNIVKTALGIAIENPVTIMADDTDILVLILHHFKNEMRDIYFYSAATRRSKEGPKIFSIRTLTSHLDSKILKNILFVHAWSGCDTTSATFGQGKNSIIKRFSSSNAVQDLSSVFYSKDASHIEISQAGIAIFSYLYSGLMGDDLAKLRYNQYMNIVSRSKSKLRPEVLPPTKTAAEFHSYRVHLQIVEWDTFLQSDLLPTEWGWKLSSGQLQPITTAKAPAPPDVINMIRCNCKSSSKNPCSTNRCSCKKNGIWCIAACGDCHGDSCDNTKSYYHDEDEPELSSDVSSDENIENDERNIFDLFI
jgi:hypothetical protein